MIEEAENQGYLFRLEFGNTFNITTITSTFRTGDLPFAGWMQEVNIRRIKHLAVASTTTGTATLTHYGDTLSTSAESTTSVSLTSSTKRVLQVTSGTNWRASVFHSIKSSSSSSTGVVYEPIGLAILYQVSREELR